jgi:hypothetical protein
LPTVRSQSLSQLTLHLLRFSESLKEQKWTILKKAPLLTVWRHLLH